VETLSQELRLEQDDLRSRLKAIESQTIELEVQTRREELRLSQLETEDQERRVELSQHSTLGDALAPAVLRSIVELRAYVSAGLPFRMVDRLQELDEIRSKLEARELTPEAAAARLWAFAEDELRLTRENGLDRQVVTVDGADVLADVARLGMVALYFRTDGGVAGMAVRTGDGWSWTTVGSRDDQKAVDALFEKLSHGIRTGTFTLPNPQAALR
jgi:hypothetical protein